LSHSASSRQFVANRQRLTFPAKTDARGKPLALTDESKTLGDYGVGEKATLRLKDLGAQTSYRNLYLWEYVSGCISGSRLVGDREEADGQVGVPFLNPLFLYLAPKIWGNFVPSILQL